MTDQMLHTPDGVRDIYNGECRQKLLLQERLHEVLMRYGYRDIQTPTFEFFNIFGKEIGTTPSKDLYKFFDKEGNTLVLRPDFTPSVARSAAKYYTEDDMPVKLCYMGDTFINSSSYQGRLKESTQCGVELIGDDSVSSDAEILSMVVESLLSSGLKEFQISVGHARFFKGLLEEAGLDTDAEDELRELLYNKNFFGVEEYLENLSLDEPLRKLFMMLGSFDTGEEELSLAKELAGNYPAILEAIIDLEKLSAYLKLYGIDKYIAFELGIISSFHYYTGIIFSGYTFGTGEPVVKGGRYDKLLSCFGKDEPAIGFAISVDQLLSALSRQKITLPNEEKRALIIYPEAQIKAAVAKAQKLRADGTFVSMIQEKSGRTREDYVNYAMKNHFSNFIFLEDKDNEA
jgi:ATP phosphoribosyltransferase regulatory subunit